MKAEHDVISRACIVFVFGAALAMLVGLAGCASDELSGSVRDNQPPDVWLVVAPPEGSVSSYKVHIMWGGWDPDGEVAYYEYAVTDNESGTFDPADTTGADAWHRVYGNESTFSFSADVPPDGSDIDPDELKPVEFRRSHTFFIRSVDDKGLASRKPAYRSFTSKTLSPVVDIVEPPDMTPNPTLIFPIATFEWVGEDYVTTIDEVQEPDSVRWILIGTSAFDDSWDATIEYIRTNPGAPDWSPWVDYATNKSWTTAPLDYGAYVFAVQVMDEAGAVSPVYDENHNLRRLLVPSDYPSVVLTVHNEYLGWMVSSSYDPPLWIASVPTGLPVSFRIWANSTYPVKPVAYRYNWDIVDPGDDPPWSEWIPFVTSDNSAVLPPVAFEYQFDSHTALIEVIDTSGYKTRVGIRLNFVPMTLHKNLLVVDDWEEGDLGFAGTNGERPSDAEHDAFWIEVLNGLEGFDPAIDMIEVQDELPINVIADYKSVIWSAPGYTGTGDPPVLSEYIRFADPRNPSGFGEPLQANYLAMYMAAGGQVMLCGENIMTNAIDTGVFEPGVPALPLIFRYELGGDQDGDYEDTDDLRDWGIGEFSFAYRYACLDWLDAAYVTSSDNRRRDPSDVCPVDDIRDDDPRTQGLRTAIPTPGLMDFPQLDLRPEVATAGKHYAEENLGLNCDIYNPSYFVDMCQQLAHIIGPPRLCFNPIYNHGCVDEMSVIYAAPVAYLIDIDFPDARQHGQSAVWGFHPVYFNPDQVKIAVEEILFDHWGLPPKTP